MMHLGRWKSIWQFHQNIFKMNEMRKNDYDSAAYSCWLSVVNHVFLLRNPYSYLFTQCYVTLLDTRFATYLLCYKITAVFHRIKSYTLYFVTGCCVVSSLHLPLLIASCSSYCQKCDLAPLGGSWSGGETPLTASSSPMWSLTRRMWSAREALCEVQSVVRKVSLLLRFFPTKSSHFPSKQSHDNLIFSSRLAKTRHFAKFLTYPHSSPLLTTPYQILYFYIIKSLHFYSLAIYKFWWHRCKIYAHFFPNMWCPQNPASSFDIGTTTLAIKRWNSFATWKTFHAIQFHLWSPTSRPKLSSFPTLLCSLLYLRTS